MCDANEGPSIPPTDVDTKITDKAASANSDSAARPGMRPYVPRLKAASMSDMTWDWRPSDQVTDAAHNQGGADNVGTKGIERERTDEGKKDRGNKDKCRGRR